MNVRQNHIIIPLLIEKQQPNFTSNMIDLTLRQKELLHRLFAEKNINLLMSIVNGSSQQEWIELYNNLLENKENFPVTIFIDGASELENSNAGIGGIFYKGEDMSFELYSFSCNIGAATNNEAEYNALIKALDISKKLNYYKLNIYSDSELLVKQVNLEYKVKNERLKKLHAEVRDKLFGSKWLLSHIRREKNRKADFLSKKGLEEGRKK